MTVRRLLGAALMVSVLLGGLVVVTAGPAVACSCAMVRSEAERVARSDAVFVGTMVSQVERIDQKARELMRSSDPAVRLRVYSSDSSRVVWTFQVSRVYKGVVGERQEIVTSMEPPAWAGIVDSCRALKFQAPGPFLVFAYKPSPGLLDPGQYMSGSCSGSRPLTAGSEPALGGPVAREPSGTASSPSPTRGGPPAGAPGGPDSWPSPASSPSPTRGGPPAGAPSGSDSSPSPTSLVVGVGVLAVGVAAGLGLAILRARRRASAD